MKYQKTDVMVTHIRAILEQNQNPEDLVKNDDVRTLSIEALISNFLEEAVSMAVMNADERLFQYVQSDTKSISSGATKFSIDDSLQRLLSITSTDWDGVVKELLPISSPIYRMTKNKYLNMTGVKDRPVAFLSNTATSNGGERAIELYPVPTQVTINYIAKAKMGYGKEGDVDEDGSVYNTKSETHPDLVIPCDDLIYEGACFYCAYLVAMVQGWQTSEIYRKEAVEALNVVNAESMRVAAAKMSQG